MQDAFGVVGAVIASGSAIYYLYDIVHGETRPQRVTWGVWALAAILAFTSTLAGGAGPGVYVVAVFGVLTVLVFLLSLIPRYGKNDHEKYDWLVGLVAILGLVGWNFGKLNVNDAAALAVIADAIAFWPTLRGAWRQPDTEPAMVWFVDAIAAGLGVLAVRHHVFAALAFPIYLVFGQLLITLIIVKRGSSLRS